MLRHNIQDKSKLKHNILFLVFIHSFIHSFHSFTTPFWVLTPFWILIPLVTEFVVSPTHDYTTFSSYGSDVYTIFISFFFCSSADAGMPRYSFSLTFFHAFLLHVLTSDVFLCLPFLDSRTTFKCVKFNDHVGGQE